MPNKQHSGKSIGLMTNTWEVLVFSKSNSFYTSFSNMSRNNAIDSYKFNFEFYKDTELLHKALINSTNSKVVLHFGSDNLSEREIVEFFTRLRNLKTGKLFYSVIWSENPWHEFSPEFLRSGLVNDFRSFANNVEDRLIHILFTNIQNQEKLIELAELKTDLEDRIQQRTLKLTETNQQLQSALVQNYNVNRELQLHKLQVEKKNDEIYQRNAELELAFKKSSRQHIQLQKALMQNEKHRISLEEALEEIQTKNDTLKAQNEEIIAQRDHIEQQHEEIQSQRDMALKQRDRILEQQQEINDNILYSSRIQSALFPPKELMNQLLPEHFVLNKPKDVVSGDFFWVSQNRFKTIIAVADCTGHGISGAMMSMLGTAFLNEIVNKNDITNSAQILEQLRERVITSLHQQISDNIEYSRDGMDIAVCIIDIVDNTMEYSGANNPVYIFRKNDLIELRPDKMPIGIHEFCNEPFNTRKIDLQQGDAVYLFTDGFADQFGGKHGKKLKYHKFKTILQKLSEYQPNQRLTALNEEFDSWRNDHEQIDDVMVLGFEIH